MSEVLRKLEGEWTGEEEIATTRWGAGGPASATIDARLALGSKTLVMDYQETRDGKPSLCVHAVIVAGPEHDQFQLFWFDSYGFVPSSPAPGIWDGTKLSFVRSSARGQTRHVYSFDGDGSYALRLESSFDGGVSWEQVVQGVYRRG